MTEPKPVAVVGVVGDDSGGDDLLESCARDDIDVSPATRRPDTPSAPMVDVITADGQWPYLGWYPSRPCSVRPTSR